MKKYILCLIMIFIFFLIVFLNSYSKSVFANETWLVCKNDTNDYKETIKFRFKKKYLYGFYREETFYSKDQKIREKTKKYYEDNLKELELDKHLDYALVEKEDRIIIKTYIGVLNYPTLFNAYMKEMRITANLNKDEIKEIIINNFKCEEYYK